MEGDFSMSWETAVIMSSVLTASTQVVGGYLQGQAEAEIAELEKQQAKENKALAEIEAIDQEVARLRDFQIWDATIKAQTAYTEPSILALRKDATKVLDEDIKTIQTRAKTISGRFDTNIELANITSSKSRVGQFLSIGKGGATMVRGYADYEKIKFDKNKYATPAAKV